MTAGLIAARLVKNRDMSTHEIYYTCVDEVDSD